MKIHEALNAVMVAVPVVAKEDRNLAQNFNFRGIDATLNAVGPALRDHKVVVLPHVKSVETKQINVGQRGTPMNWVTLMVGYTFVGPEGDHLEVVVPGEAMDAGDKAYSKAMSVALRTALIQTLALPTDERDPDADSYEIQGRTEKSPADIARDDLLIKARGLKTAPAALAAKYLKATGTRLQEEDDADKIIKFAESLA